MSDRWEIEYKGVTLNRFDHLYNSSHISERGLELAVAADFLREPGPSVLELGNVIQHYEDAFTHVPRRIVDKYERAPDVDNIDVFDIEGSYDQIVAISTIEHIGMDYGEEYDLGASERAVNYMTTLLNPGGSMLVTFPLGVHPELNPDHLGASEEAYFIRVALSGWDSKWIQVPEVPARYREYGTITPWANSVWIGEWWA
jgi:hypothetical protein